jgi:calcineurin-like phosphoesterase family protein
MLKLILNPYQNIYITSDTHAYHKNICRGVSDWRVFNAITGKKEVPLDSTRDFLNVEEMTDFIVASINRDVREDDILIHLGDFSFGGFENIEKFRNKILCKNLHIVTGNHDHHIVRNKDNVRSLFTSVHEYYTELDITFSKHDRRSVILCHFPIASWEDLNKGKIHLFGHCHLPKDKKIMEGRAMDVGMDGNQYDVYELNEVLNMLQTRDIKPLQLPKDHHESNYTEI